MHDVSLFYHVIGRMPKEVLAVGTSHVPGYPESMAQLHMFFDGNFVAQTHVNWLSPVKMRHGVLVGTKKSAYYNDQEASDKLRIYDRCVSCNADGKTVLPFGRRGVALHPARRCPAQRSQTAGRRRAHR